MVDLFNLRVGRRRHVRAFTLTELMVAVVVLLVVILAVGRIFGTASTVVANGEGNASILQEAASIEGLLRSDLDRISDQGVLLVQCVAVRNDVMDDFGAPGRLLDPTLPVDHWFRCDQMFFIAEDLAVSRQTQGMSSYIETSSGQYGGESPAPQSTASMIYYGHGFQVPYAPISAVPLDVEQPIRLAGENVPIQPWWRPFFDGNTAPDLVTWPQGQFQGPCNIEQPEPSQWAMGRQELLMADDGDDATFHHLSNPFTRPPNAAGRLLERSDPGSEIKFLQSPARNSRVDVVTTDISQFRDFIQYLDVDPAVAGAELADGLFNYRPRTEKRPASLTREDALLTANTLLGNCSSFTIDWTWADGTGRELDMEPATGIVDHIRGFSTRGGYRKPVRQELSGNASDVEMREVPTPWFGLQTGNPSASVGPAFDLARSDRLHPPLSYDDGIDAGTGRIAIFDSSEAPDYTPDTTVSGVPRVAACIEGQITPQDPYERMYGSDRIRRYRAYFGLNGDEPFVRESDGRPVVVIPNPNNPSLTYPVFRGDYTPWPSALRITATIHDSKGAIEGGRTIQFTIPLPERVQDLPEDSS